MRLRPQIVDFVGLQLIEQLHHLHRIREITIVEEEANAINVGVTVKVIDAAGVERRGPADNAVHLVTFINQ